MNELNPVFVSILNAILMVALPAVAVAACGALTVWARKVWEQIQAERPTLAQQIELYVRIAVQAAEQAGAAGIIKSKKEYAIKVVYAWLEEIGLQGINVELIEAEIERQVGKMNEEKIMLGLEEKGQGMVEYALILVLVAVVVIAAVTIMGPLIGNVFSTVNASL
jgi:pilus assembly protein Flp/PilA